MDNYKGMINNEKKFVFDLETGLMLDKSLEKRQKQELAKAKLNGRRRTIYKAKKHLEGELKQFIEEVKTDKSPIHRIKKKGDIVHHITKHNKPLVLAQSGDKEYIYTFKMDYGGISYIELMATSVEYIVDMIESNVDEALSLSSIQRLLAPPNSGYARVSLHTKTTKDGEDKYGMVSTQYLQSLKKLYDDMRSKAHTFLDRYWEYSPVLTMFEIRIRVKNPNNGQGCSSRSISNASKIWKEVSIATKYNCLYTSIAACQSPDEANDKDKMLKRGEKLKYRLKQKGVNPKLIFSNDDELQMCSDQLKTPIWLYNNIYAKYKEFYPCSQPKDKRTKSRDVIELRLNKGHFTSLLRRAKTVTSEDENSTVTEDESNSENEDTLFDEPPKKGTVDVLIKKPRNHKQPLNYKYGAYDIEATPNPDDHMYHKAYACGLSYQLEDGTQENVQFWGMDCQKQFVDYLKKNMELLNKYTIYAHNGGKYDYPNLFREALYTYHEIYMKDVVELNGRIISFKLTDGHNVITFRDSVCLFAGSLEELTRELDVKHKKLIELVKHKDINLHNYLDHKPNLETYLHNDCLGLLEVVLKMSQTIHDDMGINLSNVFTGPTLSKKQFYKKYYNPQYAPIYFLSRDNDEFIRKTYIGGRNECFKMRTLTEKMYYYDFTSLYPSVAQRFLPYDRPEILKLNSVEEFRHFYGFSDVWVKTRDFTKKPIHCQIVKCGNSNKRVFAHYKDWTKFRLFSEEIKLGMKHGVYDYKFEDCDAIKFKSKPFLHQYFQDAFDKKAAAKKAGNEALTQTYKIIACSGYGFWGLRFKDRESIIFGRKEDIDVYEYLDAGKLINQCEFENSPYVTLKVQQDLPMEDFNVSIASAITAYGRMRLWELINAIESKGQYVAYCDTDSVITSCDLTKHDDLMKEFIPDGTGDELGSLKNEVLDMVKKHNKKNDEKIDIAQQMILDGGDLCLDTTFVCGNKFYAARKTCYNGVHLDFTKLKGYKADKEDPSTKLQFDWFEQLVNNEIEYIENEQEQWNFPKSSMVDEHRICGLNILPVHKKFKISYSKGEVNADNTVTPFVY